MTLEALGLKDILSEIISYVPIEDIWNLKLVSSLWKQVVLQDSRIRNLEQTVSHLFEKFTLMERPHWWVPICFKRSPQETEKATKTLVALSSIPPVTRLIAEKYLEFIINDVLQVNQSETAQQFFKILTSATLYEDGVVRLLQQEKSMNALKCWKWQQLFQDLQKTTYRRYMKISNKRKAHYKPDLTEMTNFTPTTPISNCLNFVYYLDTLDEPDYPKNSSSLVRMWRLIWEKFRSLSMFEEMEDLSELLFNLLHKFTQGNPISSHVDKYDIKTIITCLSFWACKTPDNLNRFSMLLFCDSSENPVIERDVLLNLLSRVSELLDTETPLDQVFNLLKDVILQDNYLQNRTEDDSTEIRKLLSNITQHLYWSPEQVSEGIIQARAVLSKYSITY